MPTVRGRIATSNARDLTLTNGPYLADRPTAARARAARVTDPHCSRAPPANFSSRRATTNCNNVYFYFYVPTNFVRWKSDTQGLVTSGHETYRGATSTYNISSTPIYAPKPSRNVALGRTQVGVEECIHIAHLTVAKEPSPRCPTSVNSPTERLISMQRQAHTSQD